MEKLVHHASGEIVSDDPYAIGKEFTYKGASPQYKIRITAASVQRQERQPLEWRRSRVYAEFQNGPFHQWSLGWFYMRNMIPTS